MPNEFSLKVITTVKKIPRGRVATYQQIAALSGKPHASRGVAWVLNSCSKKYKLPWQRVINSQGRISFKLTTSYFAQQKRLLRLEGVDVLNNGAIDLSQYQWNKIARQKRKSNTPTMF